ncbi:MAG: helix-turn-helix transcriptional regulator, partial [Acidimicrobiia bacterium]|nr:helix-turn-helix transcriptional regulator [Acidimicrobiia bacterium]
LALAGLADEAQRRGAPLIAARRGADAAALTNDVVRRAELLVGAAQAALVGGEVRRAAELIAAAREADADRVSRLDARRVVVRLLVAAGDIDGARQQVEALDLAYGDTDPVATAKLLSEVARPLLAVAPFVAAPFTERVWELAASAGGSAALYAEVLYGCGRFVQGDLEGASQHTAVWPELLRLEGAVAAGSFLAETVVLYQGFSYQVGAALRLLDEIEGQIRRHCATGALVSVLVARSLISYGVDLRECVAAGWEALLLSAETGQTGLTSVAETTLAIASATVGDEALTDEVCERLLATGETRHEVWARAALGRLHLVAGRPEAAVAQFALLRERAGGQNTSFAQFEADEAEAFVRVGRIDDARALVPVLADYAAAMGPWAVGMHQRVLALVADDIDEANAHFRAAQAALSETDNRIAQGIVELSWGERLRRAKRRAEARRRLERAVELFGRVGATGFRRRAEAELAAAGGGGDRSRPTIELLGATELQMARLAVGGATNRDIASQLFVSPRTVENHLGAVYRKLGVAGRPGLLSRAAEDPTYESPGVVEIGSTVG